MVVEPDYSDVNSKENCRIMFKLTVDPNGNVLDAQTITVNTTTTDEVLLSDLKQRLIREAKYEPFDQNENRSITITLRIKNDDHNNQQPQPSLP